MMRLQPILRRTFLATLLASSAAMLVGPALAAANPAEQFVQDNIHKGLELLNNKQLSADQRRTQVSGQFVHHATGHSLAAHGGQW